MKLCLGTVQFGVDYGVQGDCKTEKREVYEILRYATDNGIDAFDTAPAYGESEKVLGEFIAASKAIGIKIISKLSADCLKEVDYREYKRVISEEISKSCTALNISKLDGYLLHNPKHLYKQEILTALNELKNEGHIDHIGTSVYSPEDAVYAANSEVIDYIQIPYNALDQRLEKKDFFKTAKANGKTIFARSVFLQGLLTMNIGDIPEYIISAQNSVRNFQNICNDAGYDYVEGSIAYVKNNKDIDYLILGVNHFNQLKEIIKKYNNIDNVSKSFIIKMREKFGDIDEKIINPTLWKR